MNSKTALITGGCGFVGRHFAKALLQRGWRVTIVDDLSTGLPVERWPEGVALSESERKRAHVHIGDFRQWVREFDADFGLVVHLAAVVGGRLTIEGDPLAVATDLSIDATLFNWVTRGARPDQVLYFSSSAAYPINLQQSNDNQRLAEHLIEFTGSTVGLPDMTYGWSKLTGEFLAQFAVKKYGLNVVSYRPFSGYGEDQDFSYPFPSIVGRAARLESPIVVWGSGDQTRDFIHIDDVVAAVFASCDRLATGDALNLGSGEATSFRRLAELACQVAGYSTAVICDTNKPEGVFARVADPTKMHRFYRPTISVRMGLERALDRQLRAVPRS
jgi:GDP-L-fucose synthase